MNNNLIGISGKMTAGKDTVMNIINDLSTPPDCWCRRYGTHRFAGKLKRVVSLLTGIPAEDMDNQEVKAMKVGTEWGEMTVRDLLIKIGGILRETVHADIWVNALFTDYEDGMRWIVPDTRYENELHAIHSKGGIVIRIQCDDAPYVDTPSETELDNAEFDYILYNHVEGRNMDNLTDQVRIMLDHFKIPIER